MFTMEHLLEKKYFFCINSSNTPDQTFRPVQPKIRPLVKKFGHLQNLLTNANITVYYTLFLSVKGPKNQEVKYTFMQIF
jgi:hypothetical protein